MAKSTHDGIHVADQPWTLSNFAQKIHWVHTILVLVTPMISLYGLFFVEFNKATFLWSIVWYYLTGFGITAGYHRLWAHRAYNASLPVQLFLVCVGSGAVQGSIKWWAREHRAHHRYTDTSKDPYCAKDGFWHSHIGWLIVRQHPERTGRVDITDLQNDSVVKFQHAWYNSLALFFGFAFPTLVAGLGWGDWAGGYFFSGVLRLVIVHHATFCVNSLAHWLGEQPFDDRHTPKDHFVTALVTLGEGYHNFHHEFPTDYRNAVKYWQYDPTKWFISALETFGLTSNLKKFSENEVQKGMVQMEQKRLNSRSSKLDWGAPLEKLPVIEYEQFEERSKKEPLVLIAGIVHDVGSFIDKHPGGRSFVSSAIGKDMTAAFNGGVYEHSNAAHNLLSTMRVAVVRGGMEVEIWRTNKENSTCNISSPTQFKSSKITDSPTIFSAGQDTKLSEILKKI